MIQPATLHNTHRWRAILFLGLILSIAWTIFSRLPASTTAAGQPPPSPREGFSAPDFTLERLGGEPVTLSEMRGQVVIINLWATWCPPCKAEMPAIENVYRAYQDQGLVVLAVNMTAQDSEADASAFVREKGLTFPILLDRQGEASARYSLRGLPSTYFVDRQGIIRAVIIGGPMTEGVIRAKVEELLAKKS